MTRCSVNIAVDDVRQSSRWYQTLLGCSSPMPQEHDDRELFDLIQGANGEPLIIFSRWDHSSLASLRDKSAAPSGHGIALFFGVPDFDDSWTRAQALNAKVIAEPHPSRGFEIPEYTLLDPDGYVVTMSAELKKQPSKTTKRNTG